MPDCLVLMPFRKDLYSRFLCVKKCGEELGLTVYRVDRYKFSGNIIEAISKAIKKADVVVADLIGSNPNVMYELAIAQSLGKRVLIIGDKASKMPFENSSYSPEVLDPSAPEHLEHLRAAMKEILSNTSFVAIHGERVIYGENLFWRRLAALAVDLTPFVVAYIVAFLFVRPDTEQAIATSLSILFVLWVYLTLTTWAWGYTLGKRLMGLEVASTVGDRLSFAQCAGRAVVSLVALPFWGVSHFAALKAPSYQAGHDSSMKTLVRRR
jgi:uncharacterized RDD family membrane protein YckC